MAFSPVTNAAKAPAEVQYKYDPIVKASDDDDAEASVGSSSDDGTSSQFPLLLIGVIVLIVGAFGAKVALDRRRDFDQGGRFPRPTVPLALMGVILIGALAFGAGGTTAAPSPKAPPGFLNIAPQEGTPVAETQRMSQGGVRSIKVPVSWALVQPDNSSTFEWGSYDAAFTSAAANGISVLPVLYATPPWLAKRTTALPKTKSEIAAWAHFVESAVQRYGNNGTFWDEPGQQYTEKYPPKAWQLWNEVNFHYFAFPVSARNYARMVNAASPVVRANDPEADIMLSGLFGRPKGPPKKAVKATKFIKQFSKYVKPRQFDQVALHPYTADSEQLKLVIRDFRKAVVKAGYRKKPMAITEIGWGSGKATNAFLKGSQAKQAAQLTSALSYLIKARKQYKVKSVYWYTWKDSDPNGKNCSFCYTTGLFKYVKPKAGVVTPLKPKQAWKAFTRLTGGFSG
ncbi:MAG: hypothetical protein JJE13_13125 [Thermoleophilia bacterium]|nr:hypothetical protein [Thermoleophilia bacterium]